MDALLSLLLVMAVIVVIMRRARHGWTAHLPEGVDPVCGMRVASNSGFLVAHDGVEYRFCSLQCVEQFEKGAPAHGRHAA